MRLFESIPSDNESVVDTSDDEEGDCKDPDAGIDYADAVDTPMDTGHHVDSDSFSDEDHLPLADLRCIMNGDKFFWRRSELNYVPPQKFTSTFGPQNIGENAELPIDVFSCLFPDELFEKIVLETNLYATQENLRSGRSFVPTDLKEVMAFFGVNILMGMKKLPSYRDYWSSHPELRDSFVSTIIPRRRFDWLLGNLHLNDNAQQVRRGEDGYDKLYKVRPLLTKLSETFAIYYAPTENVSIDESMILFKGRSFLKQYMPNKPIKRGYKIWVRASSSGYVDQFQFYTGKVADSPEKQLGARVVTDLTRSLVGKFHKVYFDNFFTSLPLLRKLKKEHVYACGTIRKNRSGLPNDLLADKYMKRGDFDTRTTEDGIAFVKWMDRRVVMLTSNFQSVGMIGEVDRKKRDGVKERIKCPQIVKDYNTNMGFVDKADQLKSTYEISRKSKKWYHRIIFHFVDVTIVNAYIIYIERSPDANMDLKTFRVAVVNGLIGVGNRGVKRGRPSVEAPISKFKKVVPIEKRVCEAEHMPIHGTSRRCGMCSTKSQPHRSKWSCSKCEIALCLNEKKNCFVDYHKKM